MTKKRVDIVLNDEELKLLKYMIKDGTYGQDLTLNEMIAKMFYLQLREDMDTYGEEVE